MVFTEFVPAVERAIVELDDKHLIKPPVIEGNTAVFTFNRGIGKLHLITDKQVRAIARFGNHNPSLRTPDIMTDKSATLIAEFFTDKLSVAS